MSNPYQSPQQQYPGYGGYSGPPPTRQRPTTATVFGILNIVFGALGIIGGLCGLFGNVVMASMPQPKNQPNPVFDLMAENPTYATITTASAVIGMIVSIVLCVAGVGLLQMKNWGRLLSIGYGVYGVISVLVMFVVNWVFLIGPLLEKANAAPGGPEKAGAIGGAIGGAVGGCFGIVYPIIVLIFMLRPSFAAAMKGQQPQSYSPQGYPPQGNQPYQPLK